MPAAAQTRGGAETSAKSTGARPAEAEVQAKPSAPVPPEAQARAHSKTSAKSTEAQRAEAQVQAKPSAPVPAAAQTRGGAETSAKSTGARPAEAEVQAKPNAPVPAAAKARGGVETSATSTGARPAEAEVPAKPSAPVPAAAQARGGAETSAKSTGARPAEAEVPAKPSVDDALAVESLLQLRNSARTVAGAAGGASGASGSGPELPDPRDTDAVHAIIKKAELAGEINPNSAKRLRALSCFLCESEAQGLLSIETPSDQAGSASSRGEACILGWSKLLVKEPQTLNDRCRDMVEEDRGGIWKKANGKLNQALKNPTYGVYELFRKLGVKPRFRGAAAGDPGKKDMFYYKEWEFRNDESFKNARKRLARGFSYCPEKDGRERKRQKKDA